MSYIKNLLMEIEEASEIIVETENEYYARLAAEFVAEETEYEAECRISYNYYKN